MTQDHPRQLGDTVNARDIWTGDILANLGVVTDKRRDGVFVIVSVRGTTWYLSVGRGAVTQQDIVFHEADSVVLDNVDRHKSPATVRPIVRDPHGGGD